MSQINEKYISQIAKILSWDPFRLCRV